MNLLPHMDIGYYRVLYALNIHKTPGLTYLKMGEQIGEDRVVYVEDISYLRYSIWGKISDGWICMYMNQFYYVKKENSIGG